MANTLNHVEVYVRVSSDGYEGQSLRFATVDEQQALTHFTMDDDNPDGDWAPKYSGEQLHVYVDGKFQEVYTYSDGQWFKDYYTRERTPYNSIVVIPFNETGLELE